MEPFDHPKALLARAETHINQLKHKSSHFFRHRKPKIYREQIGRFEYHRCRFTHALPLELGCIAFDAVNCLRSTLDHAVFAATQVITKHDNPEQTKFPFADTADDIRAQFKRGGRGVPQELREALTKLEPFENGKGHMLWALNKVRNGKIHRMLAPMGWADNERAIIPNPYLRLGFLRICRDWNDDRTVMTFAVTSDCEGAFKVGLSFEVGFFTGALADRQAVKTLCEITEIVKGVVSGLEAETIRLGC